MDSTESEDTGVFSPETSERYSQNGVHRDAERDVSENDGTNVFSPDVLQSRKMESSSLLGSKENTLSATETPITKQLEDFDRKNVRKKRYFCDVLNTSNLDDESRNPSVEEDNLEEQVNNEKRAKRFRLSLEVPSNDSNCDYTGVRSSASQEKNRNNRKKRFVVSSTQENDDSTYSDVFKSASQSEKIKPKQRFFAPPSFVESDDSLLLSNVFKSSSKNIKHNADFKLPKSPLTSQDSARYSDVFQSISSQVEKNNKRKPRFFPDSSSQESCDSSQYSDIFKSKPFDKKKKNRESRFIPIPNSPDSCDNSQCSDILKSTSKEKEVKRKIRFAIHSSSQDTEDSGQYSEIFESVSKDGNKMKQKNRFAVPSLQDNEDSSHYSDISVAQKDDKKYRFNDPSSQETDVSLRYSKISISQNETELENDLTVNPNSQEIGESLQNSDLSIEKEENINQESHFQNSYDEKQKKCEKTSSSVSMSVRSICIDTMRSSLSTENKDRETHFENMNDDEQTKCEKTNSATFTSVRSIFIDTIPSSLPTENKDRETRFENTNDVEKTNNTVSTSIRSICIDTIRSSLNISDLPSISKEESKLFNLTYDVSTSAFCKRGDVSSLVNVNTSKHELRNDSLHPESNDSQNNLSITASLNVSNEKTLIGFQEDANESATLIESENENSTAQESLPVATDESEGKNSVLHESTPVTTDESKDDSSSIHESIPVTTDVSNNESSIIHESIPSTGTDESKAESFNDRESVENTSTRKSVSRLENISVPSENSKNEYDEVVESNVTPVMSVQSIMVDTISNSSNVPLPMEKFVEESIYVAFNPSSLMLSVTEMVEASSNSVDNNVLNHLEDFPLPNGSQSGETPVISSPNAALNEENIKEHDYAMVHVTNAEEAVSEPIIDRAEVPSVDEISKESASKEIITSDSVEIVVEPAVAPISILSSEKTHLEPDTQKEEQKSKSTSNDIPCVEEITKEQNKTLVDLPCNEKVSKCVATPSNDEQISKKSPLSNTSTQSANYSLRKRKSSSNISNKQNMSVDLENSPSSPPSARQTPPNKSSNIVQPREVSNASNARVSKSNYSLRLRKSGSLIGQKTLKPVPVVAEKSPEPLRITSTSASAQKNPETSAPNFNNDRFNDTGDALFNFSNSINEIPSRNASDIPTQVGNYSSRSRNSSSSQTFVSKSSVSVFPISEIGRRSSASKEFKVPQVPKVKPKKKKQSDSSSTYLPSRPNFPKFDFYCNKRFYNYLISKMEPKYGLRTNNKAVKIAQYISEVVKEVIAMKTGRHHILIEEMKKVLFSAGIVTTHYNFYMFCFDYLPPWFRRKAIPMIRPVNCPPNVKFDVSTGFDSIG